MPWRKKSDPLFRGDSADGLAVPDPAAGRSIVDHILYIDGAGRTTQFHSTSEQRETAKRFATPHGRVYRTTAPDAEAANVVHISQTELKSLLRAKGLGKARSSSAYRVMLARRYVEQWAEHLLDFSKVSAADTAQVVKDIYSS
jgi:hypothetical protein